MIVVLVIGGAVVGAFLGLLVGVLVAILAMAIHPSDPCGGGCFGMVQMFTIPPIFAVIGGLTGAGLPIFLRSRGE